MPSRANQDRRELSELEEAVDLNQLIAMAESSVGRLLGDTIRVKFTLSPSIPRVSGKWSDLELVLLGLCAASRRALPAGGQVSIQTYAGEQGNEASHGSDAVGPRLSVSFQVPDPGEYLAGKSLPPGVTEASNFLPSLSRVDARLEVLGSKGQIALVLHLKAASGPTTSGRYLSAPPVAAGSELVLLVEDEPQVRAVTARILKAYGYTVLTAQNAEIALDHAESYGAAVRLIICDLVLPGTTGIEVVKRLRGSCREAGIVFMSGYALDDYAPLPMEQARFLRKPFTADELATCVREAMSTRPDDAAGQPG
jgi:two-component system, cell cycle sensor histidine kinase and response regulator CckA